MLPQQEFESCWQFPPLMQEMLVGRLQHRSGEMDVV
ncbi:hypothetical protein A2U01_0012986, partial [Trifolium medium]|nr:hypothetical protein [Trifolium medium]